MVQDGIVSIKDKNHSSQLENVTYLLSKEQGWVHCQEKMGGLILK